MQTIGMVLRQLHRRAFRWFDCLCHRSYSFNGLGELEAVVLDPGCNYLVVWSSFVLFLAGLASQGGVFKRK